MGIQQRRGALIEAKIAPLQKALVIKNDLLASRIRTIPKINKKGSRIPIR
jgi:hypothetical protein